jgi:hypothetical protein
MTAAKKEKFSKQENFRQLTSVLDAVIATGIPAEDLPPLLCAVAGMLMGEMCAKAGTVPNMGTGLSLITSALHVTAGLAAKAGSRDVVLRELRRSAEE